MTEATGRRWRAVVAVVGAIAAAIVLGVLALVGASAYLMNELFDNEVPSCDREPVVLEWRGSDGGWHRSAPFELVADSQTVQVDLTLYRDDGGVIQPGKSVYAIAAGDPLPPEDEDIAGTTRPFRGTVVGRGVDGLNEQITLGAGQWELIVDGGASAAEVRWPC